MLTTFIEHGMAVVAIRVIGDLTEFEFLELAQPALRIAVTLDNAFAGRPDEYSAFGLRHLMELTFADLYEVKLEQLHRLDRVLRAMIAN